MKSKLSIIQKEVERVDLLQSYQVPLQLRQWTQVTKTYKYKESEDGKREVDCQMIWELEKLTVESLLFLYSLPGILKRTLQILPTQNFLMAKTMKIPRKASSP